MQMGKQVDLVAAAGADWLHVDVMDGHFVPNLTFGPAVLKGLKGGPLPLDVHLMVSNPEDYLDFCLELGAVSMTVHCEATVHLQRLLVQIRQAGLLAGVALNPATCPEFLRYVALDVDIVLVMTVNPGFGGQSFLPSQLDKVRRVREIVPPSVRVEVDGGIAAANAGICRSAGADTLVAGSSVFGSSDFAASISSLRA